MKTSHQILDDIEEILTAQDEELSDGMCLDMALEYIKKTRNEYDLLKELLEQILEQL